MKMEPKDSMKIEPKDSLGGHGGYVGRSLVEKIQIEGVRAFKEYMEIGRDCGPGDDGYDPEEVPFHDGFAQGICKALSVLRSSSLIVEIEAMNDRYQNFVVTGSFGLGDAVMAQEVENGNVCPADDDNNDDEKDEN